MAKTITHPWWGLAAAFMALIGAALSPASVSADGDPAAPAIQEQYTMLYYADIAAARRFYGGTLGLKATFDDQWVTLYEVVPGAFLGVVQEGGTAYHPARKENSVMVSLVTTDVDGWRARVAAAGDVQVLKEPYDHEKVPIRAMLLSDPGGYTVEFFQWLPR